MDDPGSLLIQLALAAAMFVLTIAMHLGGLTGLLAVGRLHITRGRTPWLHVDRVLIPLTLALGVVVIHVAEVLAYAALYMAVGAADTLEQALYVSASAYSTASVGGAGFDKRWELLAAWESLNGFLLIGWSTAFLFEALHRIMNTEDGHPLPLGAIARQALGKAPAAKAAGSRGRGRAAAPPARRS